MKQYILAILAALLVTLGIAACSRTEGSASEGTELSVQEGTEVSVQETQGADGMESDGDMQESDQPVGSQSTAAGEQTEYIGSVPEGYFEESQRPGRIEEVVYESRDYTSETEEVIEKPAYVYLPYGYQETDTETRYDILYLMHGWTMTAGDFFGDPQSGIVNMLDHMIENGDIPPVIVVCATFDAENQSQGFSRSVEELSVFHRDLRENLIPYIESRYHTYAEGTSEEALQASREHRAFGGFSLGAVTTWYQFVYNLDYIKYFIPMSGDCWVMGTYGGLYHPVETVDYLEDVVTEGGWEEDDFRIYQGIGTSDPIWDQTDNQIQEMLTRDLFTAENLHYAIIEGGRHDIDACNGYNAFALIYRPGAQTACEDLARAIAFIHEHAEELQVDVSDYSLWGGSAGARMAAWLGSYGTEAFGEQAFPRPAAVIMQYTGLSEVTGNEPPTYNCVGTRDGIAPYRTMEARISRIQSQGTDAEIEVFEGLPHGFGLGEGTVAEGWIYRAIQFWERQMKKKKKDEKKIDQFHFNWGCSHLGSSERLREQFLRECAADVGERGGGKHGRRKCIRGKRDGRGRCRRQY